MYIYMCIITCIYSYIYIYIRTYVLEVYAHTTVRNAMDLNCNF